MAGMEGIRSCRLLTCGLVALSGVLGMFNLWAAHQYTSNTFGSSVLTALPPQSKRVQTEMGSVPAGVTALHGHVRGPASSWTNHPAPTIARPAPTAASKQEHRIDPRTSIPPNPVELLSVDHPGIRQRHKCIIKIRERHDQLLGPLVKKPNAHHPHVLLVDPAYHANVGDHMLTLAELVFLESRGFKGGSAAVDQCHYVQASNFYPNCNKVIGDTSPATVAHQAALWHAGGNWGDLWRSAHPPRINSFYSLLQANYSIVGMPQSLFYKDKDLERKDTILTQTNILQGLFSNSKDVSLSNMSVVEYVRSRVTFTWREHESYDHAVQLYPFVNNLLVPDIAFQLGPYAPIPPAAKDGVDLVLFLRDDIESTQQEQRNRAAVQQLIDGIPGTQGVSFTIVDWPNRLEMFHSKDYFFTDTAIQLLSLGKVVICDRLHAAILSYLTGLPFVYINQSTGKVEKTLRVAFESWDGCQDGEISMHARAQNLHEALTKAIQFLDKYDLSS